MTNAPIADTPYSAKTLPEISNAAKGIVAIVAVSLALVGYSWAQTPTEAEREILDTYKVEAGAKAVYQYADEQRQLNIKKMQEASATAEEARAKRETLVDTELFQ